MADPTTPIADSLVYLRADGTKLVLVPQDQRSPIANRPVPRRVYLDRSGDAADFTKCGVWVPEGDASIQLPVPAGPTDGPLVEPGQPWAAALRSAAAGQTVYLRAGKEYAGPGLTDPAVRLRAGVKLAAWPTGGAQAVVRVPAGSALVLWAAVGFRAVDVKFAADQPTEEGVRFMAGCRDCGLSRCDVTGFTFGVTIEGSAAARNVGIGLAQCRLFRNWHPQNQDSSGLFASNTDALSLIDTTFDSNGWCEGNPKAPGAIRNHNCYIAGNCGPATVHHCTFARASSHGLQLRSGGVVTNCTFVDNPIHLSVGLVNGGGPVVPGGVTAEVRGNTFVGTRLLAGAPRGWAVEAGNALDVTISGNTFARDGTYDARLGNFPAAIKLDVCDLDPTNPQRGQEITAKRVAVADNVVAWPFAPYWRHPRVPESAVTAQAKWGAADVPATRAAADQLLAQLAAAVN